MSRDKRDVVIRFMAENGLSAAADDAAESIQGIADALDDSESRADAVASALEAGFREIDSEATRTTDVVERFTQALGPDLAAALQRSGSSVEAVVASFRQAGLSLDEIEGNVDRLSQTVGMAAQVADKHGAAAAAGFDKMGAGAGRARDVIGNMVGNAVQELPGISGALGPVNVALGQMAEAAVSGAAGLKTIGPMAAGIGLVGAVSAAIPQIMDDITGASEKAFNREQVEKFNDTLLDAEGNLRSTNEAAQALRDVFKDGIDVRFGDFTVDIAPVLQENGIRLDQFIRAAQGGEEEMARFGDAMRAAGVETKLANVILDAARQQHDYLAQAQEKAVQMSEYLAQSYRDIADESKAASVAESEYAAKVREGADIRRAAASREYYDSRIAGERELQRALEERAAAEEATLSAEMSAVDTGFRLQDSFDSTRSALARYMEAGEKTPQMLRDVTQAAWGSAGAVLADAQAKAELAGATLDASDKQAILLGALQNMANAPGVPPEVRDSILGVAADIQKLPESKTIKVNVDLTAAEQMMDPKAQWLRDQAAAKPTIKVDADTTPATSKLTALQQLADDTSAKRVDVEVVTPNTAPATTALTALGRKAAEVSAQRVSLSVGLVGEGAVLSALDRVSQRARSVQQSVQLALRAGSVLGNGS